jgi:hypothetical protein
MEASTYQEIQGLSRLTVGQLREKYLDVFGEETRARHKVFLQKRIAWRLQALAEGDLSERARRRADELADDADLRLRAPRDRLPWLATFAATSLGNWSFIHNHVLSFSLGRVREEFRQHRAVCPTYIAPINQLPESLFEFPEVVNLLSNVAEVSLAQRLHVRARCLAAR